MVKRRPTLGFKSHSAVRFNEKQLKGFKLAFAAIDKERTGKIGLTELMDIYKTLGVKNVSEDYIVEEMLDRNKDLHITQMLFASKLSHLMSDISDEEFLLNLLSNMDPDDEGFIDLTYLLEVVTCHGRNKLTEEEVEKFKSKLPEDWLFNKKFKYKNWISMLKYGGVN